MLFRPMVPALLAVALSGCGAAAFSVHDLKLSPSGDTLYVLARSTNVAGTSVRRSARMSP